MNETFDGDQHENERQKLIEGMILTRLPYADKAYMFTMTTNGLFLLTRTYVMEGDLVVVLDGGKVPLILREGKQGGKSLSRDF
jgi:hypothetical protein